MGDEKGQEMQLKNAEKKTAIAKQLSDTEMSLPDLDLEVRVETGFKLPLDMIPSLGVAFASMPECVRTVVGNVSVPTLLQATYENGAPLDPSLLQKFNNGSGLLGSFRDVEKGFGQAHFHVADSGAITTTAVAPYDPTMLFMAMALSQINKKLDTIQETQEEMLEYQKQKDQADLRGNVKTLTDVLNGYKYNWDNDIWRKNAHMKVVDIKQESSKSILHLRAQIAEKLSKKGPVEVRLTVDKRMEKVLDRLKEYQLAVYNYSFAAFLEPMLSENFSEDYLSAVSEKISNEATNYRELYTTCYNAIEGNAGGSVDALLLSGLSLAGKKLGKAVAATPVGEHTPIDDALQEAGKGIGRFNKEQTEHLVAKLQQAKAPIVRPFKESIDSVNTLHNKPMYLLADSENVYLVPEAED